MGTEQAMDLEQSFPGSESAQRNADIEREKALEDKKNFQKVVKILQESPTVTKKENIRLLARNYLPDKEFNDFSGRFLDVENYRITVAIDEFVSRWLQNPKNSLEDFEEMLREENFNHDAGNWLFVLIHIQACCAGQFLLDTRFINALYIFNFLDKVKKLRRSPDLC